MAKVRVNLDERSITVMLSKNLNDVAERGANRAKLYAQQEVIMQGRIRTGLLVRTIREQKVSETRSRVVYRVGSPLKYAVYQEKGVRGPVRPKRAKVLAFVPKTGGMVFARSTRGFKGAHFMQKALNRLTLSDFI